MTDKLILLGAAGAGFMIGKATGKAGPDLPTDVSDLQAQLAAAQSELQATTAALNALTTTSDSEKLVLNNRIASLESQIANLQQQIATANSQPVVNYQLAYNGGNEAGLTNVSGVLGMAGTTPIAGKVFIDEVQPPDSGIYSQSYAIAPIASQELRSFSSPSLPAKALTFGNLRSWVVRITDVTLSLLTECVLLLEFDPATDLALFADDNKVSLSGPIMRVRSNVLAIPFFANGSSSMLLRQFVGCPLNYTQFGASGNAVNRTIAGEITSRSITVRRASILACSTLNKAVNCAISSTGRLLFPKKELLGVPVNQDNPPTVSNVIHNYYTYNVSGIMAGTTFGPIGNKAFEGRHYADGQEAYPTI